MEKQQGKPVDNTTPFLSTTGETCNRKNTDGLYRVQMHAHAHTHTHVHTHVHAHTHTHVHTHTHTHTHCCPPFLFLLNAKAKKHHGGISAKAAKMLQPVSISATNILQKKKKMNEWMEAAKKKRRDWKWIKEMVAFYSQVFFRFKRYKWVR